MNQQTKPQNAAAPQIHVPTHDEIARRAYEIYDTKGRKPGHCRQNWHQAERELSTPFAKGDHGGKR